ncbi:MAG: P-II family nitrogen regulator [Solirubrobacteraceae bacterium]
MKKVEAIIRASKLYEVRKALNQIDVNFITYWPVTGIGNESETLSYKGVPYNSVEIERTMLSFVCNDDFLEPAINIIKTTARTGEVGDGKIFVSDIIESYRIRTDEKGGISLK